MEAPPLTIRPDQLAIFQRGFSFHRWRAVKGRGADPGRAAPDLYVWNNNVLRSQAPHDESPVLFSRHTSLIYPGLKSLSV